MNGVAKITIDGREVALKFGLPAVRQIIEKMAQYGLTDNEVYSDLGLTHILFAGYQNSCIMKDEAPALAFEVFYNHVEGLRDNEAAQQQVQAAVKTFEESRFIKPLIEKLTEETQKKSLLTETVSRLLSTENSGLNHRSITGSPGESMY